jgi:hypothetical protein
LCCRFYALAALIQGHVAWLGVEPHKAVQLLSVASGFGVVVFSFLIARAMFPGSRWIQLATVAKWRRASYRPGQRGWIKIKNPAYWRRLTSARLPRETRPSRIAHAALACRKGTG